MAKTFSFMVLEAHGIYTPWKFNGLAAENLAGPQKESKDRLPTIIFKGLCENLGGI